MPRLALPPIGRHALRRMLCAALLLAASAQGQTLRWSSLGDLQTLDPHARNELLTNAINGQVYETLVTRDRTLALVPALATAWQQLAPTVWRMTLRPGVRFHDGTPLTADDVVFSVRRASDPVSSLRAYASAMGEGRRVAEGVVEFTQRQVNPIFLEHASTIPIMSQSWCEAHNAQRPQDFANREDKHTALHANGTGPYRVVARQPDVRTTFRRHDGWWGRFDGNVREVAYIPIKSDATRTAALVSGEIDLLLDPAPQDLPRLRAMAHLRIVEGVENRSVFIGMDQARDELLYGSVKGRNPFKDVRVRRALYHAVDIAALRDRLMRGQAQITGSVLPSPRGHYNDPAFERRLPFDPVRARALLAEAGYAEGFEVTLDCPNDRYVNDEEICIALSAMWAQVGVKVRVRATPRALYFPRIERRDTSLFMLGWGGAITDAEIFLTPVLRTPGPGGVGHYNLGNVSNPRLDELIAASSRESDPARRQQLVQAALREHDEQVHHIPLHRQVIPWAMQARVSAVHRADNWLEWRWVQIAP